MRFAVQVAAFAIVYGWRYVNWRGSLLIVHVFHAATNTAVGGVPVLPTTVDGDERPSLG